MPLGEKILKLRKQKGLSQEELGEKINVTRQTISNWELGETSPNPEQLKLLSKELNVSIDELLDNDVKNVLVEKVSNTEKLSKLILKILRIMMIIFASVVLLWFILVIGRIIVKNTRETGREIEEAIHCSLYGEEHTYGITYYELTGEPFAQGGDLYFHDILDLGKYNDAHQIFNIINDYVKKNGGTCHMIENKDLNDLVDISIKEGTLTNTGVTVIITGKEDYDISYGEPFWLEKYDTKNNYFKKMDMSGENCGFILPAYSVSQKPRELYQDFSCMYGKLPKGTYRLVKDVDFDSDTPISEKDYYYIWVEFSIE